MERIKTKDILQRVELDATLSPPVDLVSVRISADATPDGDRVAILDVKQVKDIIEAVEWFAAIGIKMNPRKWVKKCEPQIAELDKLKVVALHNSIGKEVHMTQSVRFVAADSVSVA